MLGGYRRSLTWVLDHPALILLIFLCTLGLERFPDRQNPQGLLPAAGYRSDDRRHARAAGHFVLRHAQCGAAGGQHHQVRPRRAERHGITGGQGATNSGFTFIALKPLE